MTTKTTYWIVAGIVAKSTVMATTISVDSSASVFTWDRSLCPKLR
jgi:hypothetical protein